MAAVVYLVLGFLLLVSKHTEVAMFHHHELRHHWPMKSPQYILDVPTKFQINRTRHSGENASFVKPRFSRLRRLFVRLFVYNIKNKQIFKPNMHANLVYQPEVSTKFQPNWIAHG
jgi:hypothetical protein